MFLSIKIKPKKNTHKTHCINKCVSRIHLHRRFLLRSSKNTIFKRLTTNPQPIQYIDSTSVSNDDFMKRVMQMRTCCIRECVLYIYVLCVVWFGMRSSVFQSIGFINCDERRRSIESDVAWTIGSNPLWCKNNIQYVEI